MYRKLGSFFFFYDEREAITSCRIARGTIGPFPFLFPRIGETRSRNIVVNKIANRFPYHFFYVKCNWDSGFETCSTHGLRYYSRSFSEFNGTRHLGHRHCTDIFLERRIREDKRCTWILTPSVWRRCYVCEYIANKYSTRFEGFSSARTISSVNESQVCQD